MQNFRYEKAPPAAAPEHEYAKLFPHLEGDAWQRLVDDIKVNGVIEPIVFLDGMILDGRNRYYAARHLGIEYPRVDYEGDDPLGFVISRNLHRRHMSESQRATAAAKIAALPHGGDRRSVQAANLPLGLTQSEAAEMLNVSERSVRTARILIDRGTPELVAAVETGKVSVSAAAKVATLPVDEQNTILALGADAIVENAKRTAAKRKVERRAKHTADEAAQEHPRKALSESIKSVEAAKVTNGSLPGDVPGEGDEAIAAELDELREENAALKADIAERDKRLALYDDMTAQFERGGFEAVKATMDEQIASLRLQVEAESAHKATWSQKAAFWKKQALALGYRSLNDEVEPITAPADEGLVEHF